MVGFTALTLAALAWRRRSRVGVWPALLLMLAVALWSFGYAVELATPTLAGKLFWANVEYAGITTVPVFWYLFVREYVSVGWQRPRRPIAPLFLVPLLTVALVWTNPTHELVRRSVGLERVGDLTIVTKEYGAWFWVHTVYSYALLTSGSALLVRNLFRSDRPYRSQGLSLVVAVALPWVANAVYILRPSSLAILDLTPIAFVVSGGVLVWALLRYGLLDVVPAARDAVLQRMRDGLVVLDAQQRVVDLNPAAQRILGVNLATAAGRPVGEVLPECVGLLESDPSGPVGLSIGTDGAPRHYDALASTLTDGRGRTAGYLVVMRDVTARLAAERERETLLREVEERVARRTAELREANAALHHEIVERQATQETLAAAHAAAEVERTRLQAVLDILPVGVVIADADGRLLEANPAAVSIWGGDLPLVSGVEGYGRFRAWRPSTGEPLAPDDRAIVRALRHGAVTVGEEVEIAASDGTRRTILNYAVPIRDGGGHIAGAVAVNVDITRRREAEEQLRALNEALERRVAERTAELRASEARFRAIFDDAALGILLSDPNCRILEANPAFQRMLGYSAAELRGRDWSELIYPDDDADERPLREGLLSGERGPYRIDRRYADRDGGVVWVRQITSLIRDPDGRPRYVLRLVENVTEQRAALAALVQAEGLAITGKMAASFAHEINNPLQSVMGVLALASRGGLDEGNERYLTLARDELQRAARLTQELRNLHHPSTPEARRATDVNDLLSQVLELTRQQARRGGVTVEWEPQEDLPAVRANPDQLHQVFLNLVLNALEAMPDGGRLSVRAERTADPAGLRVAFRDSGHGIPEDALPHIFDAFYTTKPSGTGVGLFVCRSIVEQHGGTIAVESGVGEGTTFDVWLPLDMPGA